MHRHRHVIIIEDVIVVQDVIIVEVKVAMTTRGCVWSQG